MGLPAYIDAGQDLPYATY